MACGTLPVARLLCVASEVVGRTQAPPGPQAVAEVGARGDFEHQLLVRQHLYGQGSAQQHSPAKSFRAGVRTSRSVPP